MVTSTTLVAPGETTQLRVWHPSNGRKGMRSYASEQAARDYEQGWEDGPLRINSAMEKNGCAAARVAYMDGVWDREAQDTDQ